MSEGSQFRLLGKKRFGPFFLTQFLGAFNDNIFKNALIVMFSFQVAGISDAESNTLINLAAGLFILPFFLFSATFGQLADKYDKARIIRISKMLEVVIMLTAGIGLYLHSVPLLIALLFMMGTQSSLFGPVKYGILPQHLQPEELVGGNALVESGTFLAILIGTMTGGILISMGDTGGLWVAGVVVTVSIAGYLASRNIPLAPAMAPKLKINWNPVTETWRNFNHIRGNRTVFLSILGISWFWFFGATFLAQLANYSRIHLGGDGGVVTLLLTVFSLGIGVGSLLCERLSGHRVELGLVPFGSIGLTLFGVDLYFANPGSAEGALIGFTTFIGELSNWRVLLDILLIGVFGGFYIVPLYALVQQRSDPEHRSRTIAGNNILNALFMVVSAILAIVLLGAGLSIPELFLACAIMNAAVAIYIYTLVPEFLMRFLVWIFIHILYRIKKSGMENIPEEGPAVLICNHISFMDALIVAGCSRRPVRFVMYYKIFSAPILSFIFRTAKAIPIAGAKEDSALLEKAYDDISAALNEGELVCIFPEGQITGDGEINPFKKGIERIIERNPVPVVPLALRGLWGSFFSRKNGLAMTQIPRRFWSKIELVAGSSVPPQEATAAELQVAVAELRGDWK